MRMNQMKLHYKYPLKFLKALVTTLPLTILLNPTLGNTATVDDQSSSQQKNTECTLQLYKKILRVNLQVPLSSKDAIISSNCTESSIQSTLAILNSLSGNVQTQFIAEEIHNEINNKPSNLNSSSVSIKISPESIEVHSLNDFLKNRLDSKTNFQFSETKILGNKNSISLGENDIVNFSCEDCSTLGNKKIILQVYSPIQNYGYQVLVDSKLGTNLLVLKTKENLTPHSSSSDGLQWDKLTYKEEIFTDQPELFVTNAEDLKFFVLNKTILKGQPLKFQLFSPKEIVKYNVPTKILLKNRNIQILHTGIPLRSAKYGEYVELKSTTNNKLLNGKVIDQNTVVIEL